MVKRIIVKAQDDVPPETNYPLGALLAALLAIAGGCLVTRRGEWLSLVIYQPPSFTITALLLVLLGVAWAIQRRHRIQNQKREIVVSCYALGLQLSNRQFLPRVHMRDCIVSEIVYAHTVRNAVVLRLDNDSLVDVFAGVDLKYSECLELRHILNEYLQKGVSEKSASSRLNSKTKAEASTAATVRN